MGLKSIPRSAQVFLVTVCILGLTAAGSILLLPLPASTSTPVELIFFLILAAFAGGKKVPLTRRVRDADAVSMSLGFVFTFAAMLRFGPAGALVVGAVSCLSGCLYPKKQQSFQISFNVSLSALEAILGSIVYLALNGWTLQMRPVETFVAVAGSTLTYFAVNTGGISTIIALCSDESPYMVWKETFLWTAPSFFAGGCVSALAMLMFGNKLGFILLFVAPVAYLTYQSYAVYMSRADEKQKHAEEVQRSKAELADLYLATIKSLALAIDAKDQYTHQHILRVQRYAVAIAKHMGLTGGELEAVNTGALLHDIGKLGVPEYVLLKPGRLTEDEFDKIKKHPEIGAAILDPVEFPWPVLPVVKYHHEKWDGSGYPEGLKGEAIPLSARIMAVADVYDALTSSRSYRSAWTHEKAFDVICKDAGTHFDPVVVEAFKEIIQSVIEEMALDGEGPLAPRPLITEAASTKSELAAQQIARTSDELWALYEVAPTLSASLGLQETVDLLSRKLEAIYPGIACVFLLKEPSGIRLKAAATSGINRAFFAGAATIGEESRSMVVVADGKPYLGEYDQEDLVLSNSEMAQWVQLKSSMIVPISYEGSIHGTVNLYHPSEDAFSSHDLQRIEMIAGRAAMAIYSGMLHDRSRQDSEDDQLTGLHNLRFLTNYLDERCGSGADSPFGLLCLDLSSFRAINDNFGHQKGDEVLAAFANLIRDEVGPAGLACRYGGDEFIVVVEGADYAAAETFGTRLKDAIDRFDAGLVHYHLGAIKISANVGIACFPTDGKDCQSLLCASDQSMYLAKTNRKLATLSERSRPRGLAA